MSDLGRGIRAAANFGTVFALVLVLVVPSLAAGGRTEPTPVPGRAGPPVALKADRSVDAAGANALWTNLTPGLLTPPTNRFAAASAWDAADDEGVVFGGIGVNGGTLRTTWTYHDQVWTAATPASPNATDLPSPRLGASMAYDAAAGYVVLFGGYGGNGAGVLGDTWTFVHGSWTNLTPSLTIAPSARVNASLGYDPDLGALVLFGGRNPTQVDNDTWLFRAGAWSDVTPAVPNATNTPPRRFGGSLAYDGALGGLVLFGGLSSQTGTTFPLSDSWTYSASGWQSLVTSPTPPGRSFAVFVSEPNGTDLLFGGYGAAGVLGDTWTLNGTSWTNQTGAPGSGPAARHGASGFLVATGADLGYVIVFGGATGITALGDTWETGADALFVTGGSASPDELDVNQSTVLSVVVFGPPGTPSFVWTNASAWCLAADAPTIRCIPTTPGNFSIGVRVTQPGAAVGSANATIPLLVNPSPQVTSFTVAPYPYAFGAGNLTISVHASGGTGRYSYAYAGLPPGCTTANTPGLVCAPIALGSWIVNVTVTDQANVSASRTGSVVVTAPPPGRPNPWVARLEGPLGIALIVIVLGLVGIVLAYRHQRRPPPRPSPRALAPAPDFPPRTGAYPPPPQVPT